MAWATSLGAVAMTAVLLAGCGDAAAEPRGPGAATSQPAPTTTASTTSTTTTQPPPPTVTSTTSTSTTSTSTTTTAPPSTDATAPAPTTTAAGPPPVAAPQHGEFSWAVYFGVWPPYPDAATFDQAVAPARVAGYRIDGWSDLACDQGAAEALGLAPGADQVAAALYFATEADASAATGIIGTGTIAHVQTYCLD